MILRTDSIFTCPVVITSIVGVETAACDVNLDKVFTDKVLCRHILLGNDCYTVVTTSVVCQETSIHWDVVGHRAVKLGNGVGSIIGVGDIDFAVAGHSRAFGQLFLRTCRTIDVGISGLASRNIKTLFFRLGE